MDLRIQVVSNDSMVEAIDELLAATSDTQVYLHLSRVEIEAALTGSAVDRLMQLSDAKHLTVALEGRISLVVDGFDDDQRELHQIPAVVAFIRAITKEWPYWAHFAARDDDTLPVVLRQLIDVETVNIAGGVVSCRFDPEALARKMIDLFKGMNALHALHGFTEAMTIQSTNAVIAVLNRMLGDP